MYCPSRSAVMEALQEEYSRIGIALEDTDLRAIQDFFQFLERSPSAAEVEAYAEAHAQEVTSYVECDW